MSTGRFYHKGGLAHCLSACLLASSLATIGHAATLTIFRGSLFEQETDSGMAYRFQIDTTPAGYGTFTASKPDLGTVFTLEYDDSTDLDKVFQWDFDTLEAAIQFAQGEWNLETILDSAPTSPIYQTVDWSNITVTDTDRLPPSLITPEEGALVGNGRWIEIVWEPSSSRESKYITIESEVSTDTSHHYSLSSISEKGYSSGGGGGGNSSRSLYVKHESTQDDFGNPLYRQQVTTVGYDSPAEVSLKFTYTTRLDSQYTHEEVGQHYFYSLIDYNYEPLATLHYFVIPEPATGTLALVGVVMAGCVWWRRGGLSCGASH